MRSSSTWTRTPEVWRECGDLSSHVEQTWIGLLSGAGPHVQESLLRKIEDLRIELVGTDPTPLDKLLADGIVASWLEVRYFEIAMASCSPKTEISARRVNSLSMRLDRAQKRHFAAIKALAEVRRLLSASGRSPASVP